MWGGGGGRIADSYFYAILIFSQCEFGVGKADQSYTGYKKLTSAQWSNLNLQKDLLFILRIHGGWPLLEEPLSCKNGLCIAEGFVLVDGSWVVETGFTHGQQCLSVGRYSPMQWNSKTPWLDKAAWPKLGSNWTFGSSLIYDYPCLFIRQS